VKQACPILLLAALLAPQPASAARIALPCEIPAPADFTLTHDQQGWSSDGKPWTVSLAQSVHVERDAQGFRLTIGPARATSNLDEAGQHRLAAAYDARVQLPVTLRLDAEGRFIGVEALEDHWKAYVGRLEQVVRDLEREGKSGARGRAALAALADADETTRIGLIADDAGPLLQHCGQSVEAATAAEGIVTIAQQKETAALNESTRFRVDALNGLTRSVEHHVVSKAQPDKPLIESWRFDPVK
jgi:hypothetical protein